MLTVGRLAGGGCLRRAMYSACTVAVVGCRCDVQGTAGAGPSPPSLVLCASRSVGNYPAPRTRRRTGRPKKTYNYLTGERLVRTSRERLARSALRNRDDLALQRRRSYREELLRDVEEKIRHFSPVVKRYIFFPQSSTGAIKAHFRGNRVLPTRTFTRIYVDVIDRLTTKEHRAELVELMKAVGVTPPSAEVFRRYSDPKTGKITVPLVHSAWVQRYFRELCRKYVTLCGVPRTAKGHLDTSAIPMSPQQAYVLLYFDDENKVPSLVSWSHSMGPLNPATELLEGGHRQESVSVMLVESRREVLTWGKRQLSHALAPLSVKEQQALVEEAMENFDGRMKKLIRQLEFAAKVMLAINSLPEVKAMQAPCKVFLIEKELETIVKQHGVAFPPSSASLKDWRALRPEQQQEYYCFKRKAERALGSGLQLYMRYCTRDYGLPKGECPKRYARLSDEQQAALNFPFYYPITPRSATTAAFKKFYFEMCERYGLVRSNHQVSHGNRLFEAAIRQKWKLLSPEERQPYFSDSIMAAFPLLPKSAPARGHPAATGEQVHAPERNDEAAQGADTPSPEPNADRHDVLKVAKKAEHAAAASRHRRSTAAGGKSTPRGPRRTKRSGIHRVAAAVQSKPVLVYTSSAPAAQSRRGRQRASASKESKRTSSSEITAAVFVV